MAVSNTDLILALVELLFWLGRLAIKTYKDIHNIKICK